MLSVYMCMYIVWTAVQDAPPLTDSFYDQSRADAFKQQILVLHKYMFTKRVTNRYIVWHDTMMI